jgi:hypothetical protein
MKTPALISSSVFSFSILCTSIAGLALSALAPTQVQAGPAANSAEVERLIAQGAYGKKPILWFAENADGNTGSGPKNWSATSGGRLDQRGIDPWGKADAAFGLPRGSLGGAAVSGSTTNSPLRRAAGTALMFFRPGESARPPMLLFQNADWGDPGYVALRINEVGRKWELTLAVTEPNSTNKAVQASFATLAPGQWNFVALTWQETEGTCLFRYWAGALRDAELTFGEKQASSIDASKSMLLIGGRRGDHSSAAGLPALTFDGGLFRHLAIYDTPLSEETIQAIYLAAIRP